MGFFSALFDFSFKEFVTARIVRVLYALSIVVIGLGYLASVVSSFAQSAVLGLFVLIIVGPIVALLYIIYIRVVMELFIVLFRIYENTNKMIDQGTGGGYTAPSGGPSPSGSYTAGPPAASGFQSPPPPPPPAPGFQSPPPPPPPAPSDD